MTNKNIKNLLEIAVAVIADDDDDWKFTPDKFMYDIDNATTIKIMDRAGQDLNKKDTPKYLASGANGTAYLLSNGKVLKFTKDEREARTAALVMRHPNPKYVFECFDVFKFKRKSGEMMFCIVQEYLTKPDKDWKNFVRDFYDWLIPDVKEPGQSLIRQGALDTETVNKYIESLPEDYKAKNKNKLEWLYGAGLYFEGLGIEFYDIHAKNIMKRDAGSQHCIIDLGLSQISRQPPQIETLAKKS